MSITIAPPQQNNSQQSVSGNGYFHWTVDTFYRAIAADIFDEPKRLEVVHGELWEKEKVNPPHARVTDRFARLFRATLEPTFWVMEEKPLHIAFDTEPIPDIQVIQGNIDDFETRHPRPDEVRLLIEVADTTAARDTGPKALLYAQAGIEDYWVMLINPRELWVFRNPTEEGYAPPLRLTEADTISPLAAPHIVIAVRDLVPRIPTEPNESG